MSNKQVFRIMMASVIAIGGIVYFSKNRKKKVLVKSILDTIADRAPAMDYTTQTDSGVYNVNVSGCSMTQNQIADSVEILRDSQYGAFLWMGSKHNKMISEIQDIGTKLCWSAVQQAYKQEYGSPLYSDLKDETNNDIELKELNDVIARLK